MLVKLLVSL